MLTANGAALADVLDWRWHASDGTVDLEIGGEAGTRRVTLTRTRGDWGIVFAESLFDGVRVCANACAFCFVAQLPGGLRPSLYLRDDDYRLSFLHGNFVTLTSVDEADIQRIIEQRLTPLRVSIHAVSAAVRRRLLCPTAEDRALETLDRLMEAGIEAHVQVVLIPGLNDGDELDETLAWASRRDGVLSVGIVPMGYTSHQRRFVASYEDATAAAAVLDRIRAWQAVMRVERGETWVQAADEVYLAAGTPLPPWGEYDGFPQYDNGIGLARAFIDEVRDALRVLRETREVPSGEPLEVVLVTGELFAPVLADVAGDLTGAGAAATALGVANSLFGGNVSVAGLLSRADIVAAVRAHRARGPFLVPGVVVNSDGLMLDDLHHPGNTGDTLSSATGKQVAIVPSEGRAFVERLASIVEEYRGA